MDFPKITNISEIRKPLEAKDFAKDVLSDDEYREFKTGHYTNPATKEFVDKYLTFPLDKMEIRFEMHKSPTEITNALQKACTTEQEGYALQCQHIDLDTNDENMNQELLILNIEILPLRYGLSIEEIDTIGLSLNIKNTGDQIMTVNAGDLQHHKGYKLKQPLVFPSTALTYLNIGKSLRIKEIKISRGYTSEHTKYLTAVNGAIWPLDIPKGYSTRTYTPTKYEVTFNLNCVGKHTENVAKNIIRTGCGYLISRLRNLLSIVSTDNILYVEKHSNEYIVKVEENNSIAKLLERVCIILFPEVEYMTAEIIYHTKIVTIHLKGSDARKILLDTINQCIKIYTNIQGQVS